MKIIKELLLNDPHCISDSDIAKFAKKVDLYSASDLTNLVKEAAMGPMRDLNSNQMMTVSKYNIRAINK